MKEQLISLNTAILAREKMFDEYCDYLFWVDDNRNNIVPIIQSNCNSGFKTQEEYKKIKLYSAPTQSLLQKWLRDTHQLHVIVAPRFYNDGSLWYVYECIDIKVNTIDSLNENLFRGVFQMYKTHEEALEQGLLEALKSIP